MVSINDKERSSDKNRRSFFLLQIIEKCHFRNGKSCADNFSEFSEKEISRIILSNYLMLRIGDNQAYFPVPLGTICW
jgi:hypothetical protein